MIAQDFRSRVRRLGHLVGNAPLLAIEVSCRGSTRVIYAKAENLNMTGSIKDRMAQHFNLALDGAVVQG
jgi:cysteine synthase A